MNYHKELDYFIQFGVLYNNQYGLKCAITIDIAYQKIHVSDSLPEVWRWVTMVKFKYKGKATGRPDDFVVATAVCHEKDEKTFSVSKGVCRCVDKIINDIKNRDSVILEKSHRTALYKFLYEKLNGLEEEKFNKFVRFTSIDDGCCSVGGLACDLGFNPRTCSMYDVLTAFVNTTVLPGSSQQVISYLGNKHGPSQAD